MTAALSARSLLAEPPIPETPYDGMPVSEDDYWAHYYLGQEITYEWSNGRLEEKGVSDYLTFRVFDWLIRLLIEYLSTHPIADRVGLEMGFRLRLPERVSIRRPDYGLVLHDNPVPLQGLDQSYRGIFDLCIEGISTSSRRMRERDTLVKKAEYAAAGVREYYLLHHTTKLRAFYRLGERGLYEPMPVAPEGVIVSQVLPGFQWRLTDLDRQPALKTLVSDPVYQDFVLLDYQRERARAEQAERKARQADRRAEQERARAEQEWTRAERLAARLRDLGVDPDTGDSSDQD
jgi:hypothetical protein